ncbi:copia-type polyprotein [Cucumis melo var. makuwa]|uniref:Copia-type polyprotein n=1 Tax=Cucumis melo var. makuwa TaxID=1194695 RepID=A0A5A7TJW3_CUCMM|nr:copia-type polyprotein [Cucumis melo var. makuwa]
MEDNIIRCQVEKDQIMIGEIEVKGNVNYAKKEEESSDSSLLLALYLSNRSPTRSLWNKTPQQAWTGKKPFVTPQIFEVDPLSVDSIEGHNRVSGKGFPTTGPRIEAENVVIHRGLHVSDYWDFMLMDLEVTVQYVVIIGLDVDHGVWTGKDNGLVWTEGTRLMCASFGSTRLICASFGSTRLICASFGSTRLICATFGSTRLICASCGCTRLICAFYGTTRLLCRVRAQRGADRREAGRTREGHMDASGFLIASAIKLDDKSEKYVFVGYDASSKGYKLYNPVTKKTMISRDVVFDEESS